MFCRTASLVLFLFCFKLFFAKNQGVYECYVQTIVWRGSVIRFACKYETLEKIGYVILHIVFNRVLIF